MKCRGCQDHRVSVVSSFGVALCRRCADNTVAGGEFGDYSDELALESLSLELSEPVEYWGLDDLIAVSGLGRVYR